MKFLLAIFTIFVFSISAFAQKPTPTPTPQPFLMAVEDSFALREGSRTIGSGKITKVIE